METMVEAGWYYAQGDPVGTHRWWNGSAWVGEPQPVPQSTGEFPSAPPSLHGEDDRTPLDWALLALRRWNEARGRSRRKEYWWYTCFHTLLVVSLAVVAVLFDGTAVSGVAWAAVIILYLATLIPTWSVNIRRLHDTGRSGWWLVLNIIPVVNYIGWIPLLVFFCLDSEVAHNKYGVSPKYHKRTLQYGAGVSPER